MSYIIPSQEKRFLQTNKSDLSGNIWYTKNINFDEQGYIKLSSRAVSLQSEQDDTDFDIPVFYGRNGNAGFNVITTDTPWIMSVDDTNGLSISQDTDTGVQSGAFTSYGKWWQMRLYQTTNTGLYYKSGSTWTSAGVSLTSGKTHPMEVFENRSTLAIGDGNTVKQINTSHATSTLAQLTIPSDYEVIGLSYSNNKIGVATRLNTTLNGQNKETMFFIWDGVTTEALAGIPCGSDQIISVVAYKSSWAILTRLGKLLYYNGGGFTELVSFPFFYVKSVLGDSLNRVLLGDALYVEGDLIYINLPAQLSRYGEKDEVYIENNPSGIWCYDPSVGLYHRYSSSISKMTSSPVIASGVDTATNIITTVFNGMIPATGNLVMQSSDYSSPIGGITQTRIYYVIKIDTDKFKIALTYADAIAGTAVDLTSQSSTQSMFVFLDIKDFGSALEQYRVGAIGSVATTGKLYDHLFFGGEYKYTDASSTYAHGCMTVPFFENRGYIVTPKLSSTNIEDVYQKIYIKYRPLKTTDSVIVKFKNKDILGLPVTTPQGNGVTQCVYTASNIFTTNADLSVAKTYIDDGGELECEIINGAGAGCMEQITSITVSGSTYTVTLDNAIIGVTIGNYCNIIINNWTVLGTIDTNDTNGYKEFSIGKNSPWIKVKCELRGVDTTIEELQVMSANHIKN